jgi:hypothetical protein
LEIEFTGDVIFTLKGLYFYEAKIYLTFKFMMKWDRIIIKLKKYENYGVVVAI